MMKTVQRLLEALKEPTMGVMGFGESDVWAVSFPCEVWQCFCKGEWTIPSHVDGYAICRNSVHVC